MWPVGRGNLHTWRITVLVHIQHGGGIPLSISDFLVISHPLALFHLLFLSVSTSLFHQHVCLPWNIQALYFQHPAFSALTVPEVVPEEQTALEFCVLNLT